MGQLDPDGYSAGEGGSHADSAADQLESHGRAEGLSQPFLLGIAVRILALQHQLTGLPTAAGVINAPITGVFNPAGIPYPDAFQPDADRVYEFLDFGTPAGFGTA